jgi:hypothetical protein
VTKRKCDNWLQTYTDWALPRSESPTSYILFSGLFCLAAAVRRKVYVPKEYLGGWECSPHLYIMLVGPAGEVRKTTSMNFATDILAKLPKLIAGPNTMSQAALLSKIVDSDDNSIYLKVGEFSDAIMKSGDEMYEFLTSMFDGHQTFEASTISRATEFAHRPCINMLAATTPEWIAGKMPEEVIGGGFASRCIFLVETTSRYKKMLYHKVKFEKSHTELFDDLVADLRHISEKLEGPFKLSDEAADWLDDGDPNGSSWYQNHKIRKGSKLASYDARKPTHLIKIAQLLHVAYSDELVLQKVDFEDALKILNMVEPKMNEVFGGVGKNEFILDARSMLEYIKLSQPVKKSELLRQFEAVATHYKLEEIIGGLLAAKRISIDVRDDESYYSINT